MRKVVPALREKFREILLAKGPITFKALAKYLDLPPEAVKVLSKPLLKEGKMRMVAREDHRASAKYEWAYAMEPAVDKTPSFSAVDPNLCPLAARWMGVLTKELTPPTKVRVVKGGSSGTPADEEKW